MNITVLLELPTISRPVGASFCTIYVPAVRLLIHFCLSVGCNHNLEGQGREPNDEWRIQEVLRIRAQ